MQTPDPCPVLHHQTRSLPTSAGIRVSKGISSSGRLGVSFHAPPALFDHLASRRAINRHDLDALAACFEPDFHGEFPAHPGRALRGHEQMRKNRTQIFGAVPDIEAVLVRSASEEDPAWAGREWTGTRADGTPFAMRGVTVQGVRRGRISWSRLNMEPVQENGAGADAAATAVSAVLFMVVHGPPGLFAVAYYLAAGIGLSLAAHFSGGLEAGVLVHAANNTLLFVPIVLADELATLSVPTGPILLVPALIMLAFPFVVRWLARRHNVATTAPPATARRNPSRRASAAPSNPERS